MKKSSFAIITAITAIFLLGCKEKNQPQDEISLDTLDFAQQIDKVPNVQSLNGVVIYQGTPLYAANSDGEMVWREALTQGEVLKIYMENSDPETKKIVLKNERKERNFVHVSYFDEDYWVQDIFIAIDVVPAVFTDDVRLYSKPDALSPTELTREKEEIVAMFDGNDDFDGIYYYNGTPYGKTAYIKKGSISTRPNDIVAVQIYKKITTETHANVMAELQEALNEMDISSTFRKVLKAPEPEPTAEKDESLYENSLSETPAEQPAVTREAAVQETTVQEVQISVISDETQE